MTAPAGWSENGIARALARDTFNRKALVVVPRCGWTGYECDLLVVMPCLRIIDVEIKISRSDWRADAGKDKWFSHWDWRRDGPRPPGGHGPPREWPPKVWKHYYAVPAAVYTPDLLASIPAASGVLTLSVASTGRVVPRAVRGAKPCRDAQRISAGDAVDIARLAGLRMWDALERVEKRMRK